MDPRDLTVYLLFLVLVWAVYAWRHARRSARSVSARAEAEAAGLTEPPSLHPVIDPARCIGSSACYRACPEGNVIGLIGGKAQLVNPTHCIGHGACRTACPVGAITLVFGTEKRGVDIPQVKPDFETNVPGVFIAGELGGMGLIRNAVEQGRQAMESVRAQLKGARRPGVHDVIIVGAGPAGIAATLAAHEAGLDYLTLEQESLGGTVSHYPRGKIVMTAPMVLPIVGAVKLRETSKEALLDLWQGTARRTGIRIRYQARVESIARDGDVFSVTTGSGVERARCVLLAIGRRGTPRKLGVPGEEREKVVYRLIDPEQYRGRKVLVVGGGDSALEAAASIAEQPGSVTTLSYRGDAFGRAKQKNRDRVTAAEREGRLQVLLKSGVISIGQDAVTLSQEDRQIEIGNDAVIVSAGGILPTAFLKGIGIAVDTKYGTA